LADILFFRSGEFHFFYLHLGTFAVLDTEPPGLACLFHPQPVNGQLPGPAANEPFFTARRTVYDLGDLSKPDVPVRTLKLTQSIGPHQLTVYASEFIPAPIDVVSYKWRDRSGAHRELKMPPFCLTNIDKIQTHFRQYIDLTEWSYLTSLKSEDDLAWMTISTAMKYAKTRPVRSHILVAPGPRLTSLGFIGCRHPQPLGHLAHD
jgi:hypothetical protein